ncbi:ATP-grasp fold amidoligase family protein [Alteriqipengyuania lutimaris]|nr:ATP-grasp fold amidoligase family protein [Alteriqipengyuania lutimaris]MBB3034383.1 hypothetical protein [Alteriqipengyuania lutimaris]
MRRWKGASPAGHLLWLEWLRARGAVNLRRFSDREAIIKLYRDYSGREPDLENPVRFSEKLQWLKLNNRDPLQTVLADKHAVRGYLADRGYGDLLCRQIACVENAREIDFDALPDRFVAKAAHASGWNLICTDKSRLNRGHARRLFAAWLRQGIFWNGREWPYRDMPRRVVIEEFLSDSSGGLRDYKFYCFHGEPRFIQANAGRGSSDHAQNFYDLDWNILPFGKDLAPRPDIAISPPASLQRMGEIARELAAGHPYVRVDLYDLDGKVVFGELTFYPASGLPDFIPDGQDFICGDMLSLSAL